MTEYRGYRVGDVVRIKSGPFASFTGKVDEVDDLRPTLKVSVVIFGRRTQVDLSFLDVDEIPRTDWPDVPFTSNN